MKNRLPSILRQGRNGAAKDSPAGASAPLGGTHAQAVQRLQIGISGIIGMGLLLALASVIQDRARDTEDASVPEAAPTVEPVETPQQSDPLADAGIVPDLPAPEETGAVQEPPILPEEGREVDDEAAPN